ncbi:poly(rC)-binding protein 1-like, partial [Triticum dicoccoides]
KWKVGVIIGNSGETIKHIQLQSGAKIQVTRDMDVQSRSQTRLADLSGTPNQISRAEQLISDVLAEVDANSFGTISNWKYNAPQPSVEQFQMQIANKCDGVVARAACGGLRRWAPTLAACAQWQLHASPAPGAR